MTADMFFMPCGLNGAVYFVEMDADGGKERATASGGSNTAGAKYGTGYCDAQCPHDMKFMEGRTILLQLQKQKTIIPHYYYYSSCSKRLDLLVFRMIG